MRWELALEESRGGGEEITVLVVHGELLSGDSKYFSEEKDLKSIVGASIILKVSESCQGGSLAPGWESESRKQNACVCVYRPRAEAHLDRMTKKN